MTDTILDDHKKWRDELIYTLRMDDVPGDRIGDILLEVDTHVRETGEAPTEAFGPAKAYAKERANAATSETPEGRGFFDISLITIGLGSFAGAVLYASGAIGLGEGSDAFFDIPAWLAFIVGAVILGIIIFRLPFDLVRHPTTGQPLLGDSSRFRLTACLAPLVGGVVLFLLGRVLA